MSCAKQLVVAVIKNKGRYWVGTNWCHNPQTKCPRGDMPSGEGYENCQQICKQNAHAEIDAIANAGENARGGTLYLYGHTYCCEKCRKAILKAGIVGVIYGFPDEFNKVS